MQTLKLGSKGDDVITLQILLGINSDGIFGPKTDTAVKTFQREHRLTADGIVGQKTWTEILKLSNANGASDKASNDINIVQKPINVHITKCSTRTPKYIAIHYTAGGSSKPGSALAVRNVFLKRDASADFAIDDNTIVQFNPDISHYYCWSVGDNGGGKYVKNANSISIEICSNLKKGYSGHYPNHDGWYFTNEAIQNAVKLTKYLMRKYNIPKENVVRHFDVTGKNCPGIIGWNTANILNPTTGKGIGVKNNESEWIKFKKQL